MMMYQIMIQARMSRLNSWPVMLHNNRLKRLKSLQTGLQTSPGEGRRVPPT